MVKTSTLDDNKRQNIKIKKKIKKKSQKIVGLKEKGFSERNMFGREMVGIP